ncbi:MAG: PAC2 family protein [Rudaea sp.]
MHDSLELWERPAPKELYMIAGWRQWADAGSISSELPLYVTEKTGARAIGRIRPDGYYLFQVPGTHHLFRPEIKLKDGHRQSLEVRKNEIHYAEIDDKGLVVFLGDEPQLNVDGYAGAFFDIASELGVKRIVALGGVYGPVPHDRDRQVSCVYSLPGLKPELKNYSLEFSNYEGGATIGSYLSDAAEQRGIEYLVLNAFVPMYDLSQLSSDLRTIMIERDYRAWYDLLERLNYMFKFGLDLQDLGIKSRELTAQVAEQIDVLARKMPQIEIKQFVEKLTEDFEEKPFAPLDDVWERGLDDIL